MQAKRQQRGAVLLIVMLVMLGLLGLGITALWLTSGNLQIGGNLNQRTQALYVAEAGVARARAALNAPGVGAPQINALIGGAGHVAYDATATPGKHKDEIPAGVDTSGHPTTDGTPGVNPARGAVFIDGIALDRVAYPDNAGTQGQRTAGNLAQSMGWYTVFVRNDTAEIRKGNFTTDTDTAVIVRSEGVAADGRTTVVLEVSLGGSPAAGATPPVAGSGPVLGYSGKNSQDDNNSVVAGIVAN